MRGPGKTCLKLLDADSAAGQNITFGNNETGVLQPIAELASTVPAGHKNSKNTDGARPGRWQSARSIFALLGPWAVTVRPHQVQKTIGDGSPGGPGGSGTSGADLPWRRSTIGSLLLEPSRCSLAIVHVCGIYKLWHEESGRGRAGGAVGCVTDSRPAARHGKYPDF